MRQQLLLVLIYFELIVLLNSETMLYKDADSKFGDGLDSRMLSEMGSPLLAMRKLGLRVDD
jgi:hypothetical protein